MSNQDYPAASWAAAFSGDRVNGSMTVEMIASKEQASGKALVNSDSLPKDGDWETLKAWGIQIAGDKQELFYDTILPDGWSKVADKEDSRHSYLLDEKGRKRGSIFFKDAYYDRYASITVHKKRYYVSKTYGTTHGGLQHEIIDKADQSIVKQFEPSYYAVMTEQSWLEKLRGISPVGLLCGDLFYYDAIESYEKPGFRKSAPKECCKVITQDVMFKQYHHVNPIHDEIRAADAKSQEVADLYLAAMTNEWD